MNRPDHARAQVLLAAYRRSTGPVDEAALLRSIVARIVADEPERETDEADTAPRVMPTRRRSLVPRVVAIGVALAAGLVLVLSLEGRGLQAEEDARRFQSSDGHGGGPSRGRIWLRGSDDSADTAAPESTRESEGAAATPRADGASARPGSHEPRGALPGSRSAPRASEPSQGAAPPSPAREGIGAWPGWPAVDDEPTEPRTGGAGGLPAGSGSGGDPKKDDDTPGRDGAKRAPKSTPRPQPSGDGGPSGDPSPPSQPPRDGADVEPEPEPPPGCESEYHACLDSGAAHEDCGSGLEACLQGEWCEDERAACLEARIDAMECDAWWQACVSPAPLMPCAEQYDGCMQATGDPQACFVQVEACVQATPEAFECEIYGNACSAAFPDDPYTCEALMMACWTAYDPCTEEPGACGDFGPELACQAQLDDCLLGVRQEDPQAQLVAEQCYAAHEMCIGQAASPEDACVQTYAECSMSMPDDLATCDGDFIECLDELG